MNLPDVSLFELARNEVHFWHCHFDRNLQYIEEFWKLLSADERLKASKYKFERHRQQAIISRGILRILLGRYLRVPPDELKFGYTKFGKPHLDMCSELRFNVSHSGNRAAFGFTRYHALGVDIEELKTDVELLEIAQHFFSFDEIEYLKRLPLEEQIHGFYRCWTRKEAFIKAKGNGLSFDLTSFSVSLDMAQAQLLRTDWNPQEKSGWSLMPILTEPKYVAAIAVQNTHSTYRTTAWEDALI